MLVGIWRLLTGVHETIFREKQQNNETVLLHIEKLIQFRTTQLA